LSWSLIVRPSVSISISICRSSIRVVQKLSGTTSMLKEFRTGYWFSIEFYWRMTAAKQNRARALICNKNTYRHCAPLLTTKPRSFWFMEYLQRVKIVLIYGTFQQRPHVHRRRLLTSRTWSRLSSNKTRFSCEILQNSIAKREQNRCYYSSVDRIRCIRKSFLDVQQEGEWCRRL